MKIFQAELFIFAFAIDRVTKSHIDWFHSWNHSGPFSFEKYLNAGFILQSFSDHSAFARIVFVSSLYGFLFFGFFLIQYMLPAPLKLLRVGLTLFFASITGNCFDRAMDGAVTDFIGFTTATQTVYFNFADVFMWIGLGCVLYSIFKSDAQIWHPNSKRKKFIINLRYQFRSAFQTSLVAFSATLIVILFSFTYLMNVANGIASTDAHAFLLSAGSLGLLFSLVTFFASVVFSHRSAGPLYAFERYVDALLRGENVKFSLRKNDDHQDLLQLAEKLKIQFESLEQVSSGVVRRIKK